MFKLPDVARPSITHQCLQRIPVNPRDILAKFSLESLNEVVSKQRNILGAIGQRRYGDREHIKSVIQIQPKFSFGDELIELTICSSDDPYINSIRVCSTKSFELSFLQNAQQLCLRFKGKFTHFVEEDGAAVCYFKSAELASKSSGKRPFFVAEELALHEIMRKRCTIDSYHRLIFTLASRVNRSGD